MSRRLTIIFTALMVLAGFQVPARANLIFNGNFAIPGMPAIHSTLFSPIGYNWYTSVPGWTIDTTRTAPEPPGGNGTPGGPYIEYQSGGEGSPYPGDPNLVELDADVSTFIYQDISTSVGLTYYLSFAFSPRPAFSNCDINGMNCKPTGGYSIDEGPANNHIEVLVGTPTSQSVVFDQTASGVGLKDTQWTQYAVTFTALSTTTRIEFGDGGLSNGYGTFLDNISTDLVPEPGTLWMMAGSLLLVGLSRSRQLAKALTRN